MKITLIIVGVLIVIIIFLKLLSGEKERIKTLFRIYKAGKAKFPEKSERELLEIVIGEFIPPDGSTRLKNTKITGKQYIDEVFESKPPDIDKLISHIVALEFPKKYKPYEITPLEEIRKQNRTGKISSRDKLELLIKKYHQEYLGKK